MGVKDIFVLTIFGLKKAITGVESCGGKYVKELLDEMKVMTPFSKSAITDRVVLSISTSVERSRTFWQHSPLSPDFLSDSSGSLLP
ncbi:hypothetical protein CDAR_391871 [Caerostris darwini]|uniref:Uncharacterized protein n=1 Tax=Caerostris darwini TaxID=1538125 RepID=A0AAV4S4I4_9ARAC|nr:hypothetical protein CDAR_391871 [Caerostris darwini]